MPSSKAISLSKNWPKQVKSALIHTISLTTTAFMAAYGRISQKRDSATRLLAELDIARREIALLKEEIRIKDARFKRLSPRRRPNYTSIQRLQILRLKAIRGWTTVRTAEVFLLNEHTVTEWLQRIDEEGEKALLQMPEPVSKFPEFVRAIVRQLKSFFPRMGKDQIASILARAGLHLGATTVERSLRDDPSKEDQEPAVLVEDSDSAEIRVVTSKYPGHVWLCDLTVVPTSAGFWTSWLPHTWSQVWPFCWWVAVVIDHFSRSIVGFAVFKKKPTSLEIRSFLGRTIGKVGKPPKYLITDKDSIFDCPGFKRWCRQKKKITPRYGAVGKHGSIAIIERFIKTMKDECTREVLVPLRMDAMRKELAYYTAWYNEHRPHSSLGGMTPNEFYEGQVPANTKPRYEPRLHWPRGSPCAGPQAKIKGRRGCRLVLQIAFMEGRRHLPVIELKRVA
jgi:transposase InsO family protein